MATSAILGRDFVTKPGVNLNFSDGVIKLELGKDVSEDTENNV